MVAEAEHPAGEADGLAGVFLAELVAGMGAIRMQVCHGTVLSFLGGISIPFSGHGGNASAQRASVRYSDRVLARRKPKLKITYDGLLPFR